MSNRYAHVVVLCEDSRHYSFVRRCLTLSGVEENDIFAKIAPAGQGAGAQYVLDKFPSEVQAIRRRACRAGLVVVIDADTLSVDDRFRQLEQSLIQNGKPCREKAERIAVLTPKRNIETWVFYLRGNAVNESENYKHRVTSSDVRPAAAVFAEMCPQKTAEISVPSLRHACGELTAFLARCK